MIAAESARVIQAPSKVSALYFLIWLSPDGIAQEGRGYTWLPAALTSWEMSTALPALGILHSIGNDFIWSLYGALKLTSVQKRWSSWVSQRGDTDLPGYTSAGSPRPSLGSLNQMTA